MSFESELRAHLLADSSISDLVGERIYPIIAPQRAPTIRITYSIVFGETQNSLDGFTSGLTRYRVQLDCWSQSFDVARRLALAVRNRLKVAATSFQSVIVSFPSIDDYEDEAELYRRSLEVSCWHTES